MPSTPAPSSTDSITVRKVSQLAGVSTATVSRVFNGFSSIRPETRARVEWAIKQLGYTPNLAGRMLARRRTESVGVLFPDFDDGFFSDVLRSIHQHAAAAQHHLIVALSHDRHDQERLVGEYINGGRVDGLLVLNLALDDAFVRKLVGSRVPVVLMDRGASDRSVPSVMFDNRRGAEQAMRHLLDVVGGAWRDVLILAGPDDTYDAQERLQGCRAACEALHVPWDQIRVERGDFSANSARESAKRWLAERDRRPLPRAVFAHNDMMALGALEALRDAGVRIGEDVKLIGFDDIPAARFCGLTTVRLPMREMGETAVNLLLSRLTSSGETGDAQANREEPPQIILPSQLITRRTTHP